MMISRCTSRRMVIVLRNLADKGAERKRSLRDYGSAREWRTIAVYGSSVLVARNLVLLRSA